MLNGAGPGVGDEHEALAFLMVRVGHNFTGSHDFREWQAELLSGGNHFPSGLILEPLIHDRVDLVGVTHEGAKDLGFEEARIRDQHAEQIEMPVIGMTMDEAIAARPDRRWVRVLGREAQEPGAVSPNNHAIEVGGLFHSAKKKRAGFHFGNVH